MEDFQDRASEVETERLGISGYSMLWALVLQVALGSYLLAVPDDWLFNVTQIVVALHVFIGVITIPFLLFWFVKHIRERRFPRIRKAAGRLKAHKLVTYLLSITALVALGSGFWLVGRGEGTPAAHWHTVLGIAPFIPLAVHLAMSRKWTAAVVVLGSLALCAVGTWLVPWDTLLGDRTPVNPKLKYAVRSLHLYDSAVWCGECHEEVYDEWKHSTHARALKGSHVIDIFSRSMEERGREFVDTDLAHHPKPGHCGECHAHISYYGEEAAPILRSRPPANEGVTCSFCHTLRGDGIAYPVQATEPQQPEEGLTFGPYVPEYRPAGHDDQGHRYISAPETVRRYMGQASENPVARALGNMLIRWRPQVHRVDYHVPYLDTSNACRVCHQRAYSSWAKSRFAKPEDDAEKPVECQDCHMVKEMTGKARMEPGRFVEWGSEHPQRRSHYFLGGNVRTMAEFSDDMMVQKERLYAQGRVILELESAKVNTQRLEVAVKVDPWLVGHDFPLMEFEGHIAFLQLRVLNNDRVVVAATEIPKIVMTGVPDVWRAPPKGRPEVREGWPSAMIHKDEHGPDTTIHPGEPGYFTLALPGNVLDDAGHEIEVALFQTFDPEPITVLKVPFNALN